MRRFGVSYGVFSGRIHCGLINNAQNAFLDGKEDCTDEAVWSAAEYVVNSGGEIELTSKGGVTMRIRAEVTR